MSKDAYGVRVSQSFNMFFRVCIVALLNFFRSVRVFLPTLGHIELHRKCRGPFVPKDEVDTALRRTLWRSAVHSLAGT